MLEYLPLEKFMSMSDEELRSLVGRQMSLKLVAGMLNDLTPEQMATFNECLAQGWAGEKERGVVFCPKFNPTLTLHCHIVLGNHKGLPLHNILICRGNPTRKPLKKSVTIWQ
jgi:hypothetical protein